MNSGATEEKQFLFQQWHSLCYLCVQIPSFFFLVSFESLPPFQSFSEADPPTFRFTSKAFDPTLSGPLLHLCQKIFHCTMDIQNVVQYNFRILRYSIIQIFYRNQGIQGKVIECQTSFAFKTTLLVPKIITINILQNLINSNYALIFA